jgi:hypothetical protein
MVRPIAQTRPYPLGCPPRGGPLTRVVQKIAEFARADEVGAANRLGEAVEDRFARNSADLTKIRELFDDFP